MRTLTRTRLHRAVVMTTVILLPLQQLLAASPAGSGPAADAASLRTVRDVALQDGGVFRGQLVDAQGAPCKQAAVRLVQADAGEATAAETDDQGRFEFRQVTAGLYRVETSAGAAAYRLWSPAAAPPSAGKSALVIQGDPAVRGNLANIGPLGWALIGLGVAAAIAIPLALADDDDDAS